MMPSAHNLLQEWLAGFAVAHNVHRAIGLLKGPRRRRFLMSEVPLQVDRLEA